MRKKSQSIKQAAEMLNKVSKYIVVVPEHGRYALPVHTSEVNSLARKIGHLPDWSTQEVIYVKRAGKWYAVVALPEGPHMYGLMKVDRAPFKIEPYLQI